jgi:hypothetical protein
MSLGRTLQAIVVSGFSFGVCPSRAQQARLRENGESPKY